MGPVPAGPRTVGTDAPASPSRSRGAHRKAGRGEVAATPEPPPSDGSAHRTGSDDMEATGVLPLVDRAARKPGVLFEKSVEEAAPTTAPPPAPPAGGKGVSRRRARPATATTGTRTAGPATSGPATSGPATSGPAAGSGSAPAGGVDQAADVAGTRATPSGRSDGPLPAAPTPWLRRLPVGAMIAFLVVAGAVAAAHVAAAVLSSARVAGAGEVRLAVAAMVARGSSVTPDPLVPTDRFAALQIAVVQLLLPGGDPADAARWACLALGAATALMLWPVLRGLRLSVPATAVAVALLGLALPLLELRAGVTAAAPAALWLTAAGAFAVRQRGWAALACAAVAVATAPLAAVPLLGLIGHLVLGRSVRVPAWRLAGVVAVVAAVAVAVLSAAGGPLAGTGGPDVPATTAVVGSVVAVALLVAAAVVERWARPLITGAVLLLLAGLVPGPSRLAAALLVAPLVATAAAVLVDRMRRPLRWPALAAVAALLAVPALVGARAGPVVPPASLARWVAAQTGPDTVVVADALDRAALLDAGVPAARLRNPEDPPVPGELRLVSDRPGGTAVLCPQQLVLATAARGSGGAPGAVCATEGDADDPAVRARFGTALAGNPMLQLAPPAAAALRAGDVDSRLMLTLAALSGAHRLVVADVPAASLDAPGVPRRQVVLTVFDGAPAGASSLLATWLRAQQAPFAPIIVVPEAGGALRFGYPVPAPAGLLPT